MTNNRRPQLSAISTNLCPNSKRRAITDLSTCDLNAMTAWGYCTECWEQGRVPSRWADTVDREIARLMGVNP